MMHMSDSESRSLINLISESEKNTTITKPPAPSIVSSISEQFQLKLSIWHIQVLLHGRKAASVQ